MEELHFVAFGALDPVDNGYKSTATQLVKALSRVTRITLFRLPRVGEVPEIPIDRFDEWCATHGVPVVRVPLRRNIWGERLLGLPMAATVAAFGPARSDWIEALRAAGLGRGRQIVCFGMGWDPFPVRALQHFASASFFPADSITLFEANRRTPSVRSRLKRRLAVKVAACMERRVGFSCITRVLFVSPRDAACAARLSGGRHRVAVVPIGVDPAEFPAAAPLPLPPRILFSGVMDYLPNRDAAHFLVEEIVPRVVTPGVCLRIVGKGALGLRHLARDGIELIDWVPSLPAALRDGTLFVSPLRMGAGAKNKVVQSLAAGVPVIGTRSSFSGFATRPPGTFVCETAAEFAAEIDRLAADRRALLAAANLGREFVLNRCTWAAAARRLLSVVGCPGDQNGRESGK